MSVGFGRKRILIVDDEDTVRDSLALLLRKSFDVVTAADGVEALARIAEERPDLMLLDVLMPTLDGIETLKRLKELSIDLPVVMLTASNTVRTAVEAMKVGALDYLNKPFDIEELTSLIVRTLQERLILGTPQKDAHAPIDEANQDLLPGDFGVLVGRSPLMQELFEKVEAVASKDTTVLILGESGTGKELVARRLHELSRRVTENFVPINCAAIPETLIESELFGHEKGAFTHAIERRIGHFEIADKGTLFLDEIGELGLPVQVKMLRFLQEQEFYRVGRSKPIKVDVRIVAATNKDLEELIEQKKFRQDLFYRINVVMLPIPALRERTEDIVSLAEHFTKRYSAHYGGRLLEFSDEAKDALTRYRWPGNVRELENVVESLMALSPTDQISLHDLPRKVRDEPVSNPKSKVFQGTMNFEDAERMFEYEMIMKALKRTNYVQTRAAELLGISRRILKYKMDKLGISDKPEEPGQTGT